ncbi:DNA-directed RNA polymerase III subunit RPC7-like isoform X1 [Halichondria panicea]|uniref:DNA-directed RNA polymerase III subunit RPC7-like isoform X1 n=1 Tax=Halichondria panicea TaxID=6063 RepID=UPI00312BA378
MSRGRGRGRGRGKPFANMEGIGLAPGAAAPPPILKPPPLYPVLERKPMEMKIDDVSKYLYSIKQEFRQHMKQSPFHLKKDRVKASIDRYSDKYQEATNDKAEETLPWKTEWSYFPEELQLKKKRKIIKRVVKTKLSTVKRKKRKIKQKIESESDSDSATPLKKRKVTFEDSDVVTPKDKDVLKKLKELEKTEGSDDNASGEEAISGDEEYYDEVIEEEGTDYNQTYFDNGEDFVEEDNLEENEGPYY